MKRALIMLGLLTAGAVLATMGTPDRRVELASVFDFWHDVLRDADQVTLKATRVSDAEEMKLGNDLAQSLLRSYTEDPALSAYVGDVASRLVPGVTRKGIQYHFHVIDSLGINAFALPGGQIFVLRGLLNFVQSEAELASVVGHEISHVDLRHCIEHYQYELRLGKSVEFLHTIATSGFGATQESEADAEGERLAVQAGYDPQAASNLFWRMKREFGEPTRTPAATPAGEVSKTVGTALGNFFRSHPPSEDRAVALGSVANRFRGQTFYVGKQNLQSKIARAKQQYPGEFRKL